MALVVNDSMTGSAGTTLQTHVGELGANPWTQHANGANNIVLSNANRARLNVGTSAIHLYYASGVPASAEYDVDADIFVASLGAGDSTGIVGRLATAADTFYCVRYIVASGLWQMFKQVAGAGTVLGPTFAQTLTVGNTYNVKLEIRDASKKAFIDGVERITSADNAIVAAGLGGIRGQATTVGDAVGLHIDNFNVVDLAAGIGGGFTNRLLQGVG